MSKPLPKSSSKQGYSEELEAFMEYLKSDLPTISASLFFYPEAISSPEKLLSQNYFKYTFSLLPNSGR